MAETSGKAIAGIAVVSFLAGVFVGYKMNTVYRNFQKNRRDRLNKKAYEIQRQLEKS